MSFFSQVLNGALFGRHPLDVADADPRTLSDLGYTREAASRARFNTFRFGEPGASYAARLGVNGR